MSSLSAAEIANQIETTISSEDIKRDSTLQSISELSTLLSQIESEAIDSILLLGAGKGALTNAIGDCLKTDTRHAVDVDEEALTVAAERGIRTHKADLEREKLPLTDDSIDFVGSFGLLEHLTWYDNVFEETTRILRDGGYAIFAVPNMAGWTNRLSLITGYQPRNIEFSKEKAFGILEAYGTDSPVGHVHTPTVGAFKEFLKFHDFEVIDIVGLHPYQKGRMVAFIDKLVSRRPSLCRRFAVLGRYQPDR